MNNQFTIANGSNGVEFGGGHLYGGYHYSLAIVDQNTSGVSQGANTSAFVPSPTGGSSGGVGFASDSNFKDVREVSLFRENAAARVGL